MWAKQGQDYIAWWLVMFGIQKQIIKRAKPAKWAKIFFGGNYYDPREGLRLVRFKKCHSKKIEFLYSKNSALKQKHMLNLYWL